MRGGEPSGIATEDRSDPEMVNRGRFQAVTATGFSIGTPTMLPHSVQLPS